MGGIRRHDVEETRTKKLKKKSKGLYIIMVAIIKGKGSRVLVLFGYI